jgi:tetratricopeptide (TPR) repeat protein/hypothetical membrane protein
LAVLTVLLLAPFLGKAIHIDDTLFVWTAKHILKHPFDPYGFRVFWYGSSMPMHEVTKNPPLAAYYAALTGVWSGWSEFHLHLAFLLPPVIVVLGVYRLARSLCDSPALAAVLMLGAPGFLVSSTSLMSDVPMLALWLVAVVLWREGLETESPLRLGASALAIAACALTKYFGACLIPLLLLYSIRKRRRGGLWGLWFLVPVCILAGYQVWTRSLYGHGLLSDAVTYARESQNVHPDSPPAGALVRLSPLAAVLVGLSFLGGGALPVLTFGAWLWSKRAILAGLAFSAAGAIAVALGWIDAGPFPRDHQWFLAVQLGLFIGGGLSVLALAWSDFWHRRDADSVLLLTWVLGTFSFAAFVNWTVNARSVLPLIPAVAILIVRALGSYPRRGSWILAGPLAASLLLSLWVTWSDTRLANSAREAAEVICGESQHQSGNVLFQGHWGFQYYMEALGAHPMDQAQLNVSSFDTVVEPSNNCNVVRCPPSLAISNYLVAINTHQWVTTLHPDRSAGFYSSVFGVLPFAFGPVPEETYRVIPPGPLGAALYGEGQMDAMIRQLQKVVRRSPEDTRAYNNLGVAFARKGQIDEGIQQFQEALRLKPDDPESHNNLGSALDRKGQPEEAIRQCQEAIRLKQGYAEAHYNLAHALAKTGQLDEAISQYQEALRLKPDFAQAHHNLGSTFLRRGQTDEAIRQYQEALRLKPDYVSAHYGLGIALYQMGRAGEAIPELRNALRLKPDYADARKSLELVLGAKAASSPSASTPTNH